jgi:fatty acid desaturase
LTSFGGILVDVYDDTRPWQVPSVAQPSALVFLIPGLCVGLLSLLQIYSKKLFNRKANARATSVALWLNTIGAVGWCLLIPVGSLNHELKWAPYDVVVLIWLSMTVLCTLTGIVFSITNLSANLIGAWQARRVVKLL